MKLKTKLWILFFLTVVLSAWNFEHRSKPVVYLIGDSTVDEGSGNNGLWGWGKYLCRFFDSTKISIKNYAQGGTSARTFYTGGIWDKKINKKGMWDTVSAKLKKGDYLIIQFGLNDQGLIDDSSRARGTLRGIGDSSLNIYNKVTHQNETVYSFGWYLKQYIRVSKEKGVAVIICSSIPKNEWKSGKLIRGEEGFASWALEVAQKEKVYDIDLNNKVADIYDKEGQSAVSSVYHISKDHVHTTEAGAILNASLVAEGILEMHHCPLKKYIDADPKIIYLTMTVVKMFFSGVQKEISYKK